VLPVESERFACRFANAVVDVEYITVFSCWFNFRAKSLKLG